VGGQIGYNWQVPNRPWVLGVETDVSALDSDGTNTCLAFSALSVSADCHVHPNATGSLTVRVAHMAGSAGRTLLYVKGGAAWINEHIDITTNGYFGLPPTAANRTNWGWIVGGGIERALTPAWSLGLEYDYRRFTSNDLATPIGAVFVPNIGFFTTAGAVSRVTQALQEVKLGLNYKLGVKPWSRFEPAAPPIFPLDAWSGDGFWSPAWETEFGIRYVYGLGRFQKDLAPPSLVSRLTYDEMKSNAGEVFARLDSPQNLMIKGLYGIGHLKGGHMNDEDWGIGGALLGYSNTLSTPVENHVDYWAADIGYDLLRTQDHKLAPFVGYNEFHEDMGAFGCAPVSAGNCVPPVPATGSAVITEHDKWQSVRFGVAGETMLTPRIKLSAEVAYLPYVKFTGEDHHIFGNSGILAEVFPETGTGRGVQLEGLLSYYMTRRFSMGVGGRYWAMWTTNGEYSCSYGAPGTPCAGAAPTPQFPFRAAVEQTSAFVQASYRLQAR
jgi:opacity protein-like surface antigen